METRIPPLEDERVPADSQPILDQTRRAIGMVPNLYRTLAHAPAALQAYSSMAASLAGGSLSPALREQIALTSAGVNGCEYCASAHTMIGKGVGLEEDELTRNLDGASSDPKAEAALRFVRALIEQRGAVADSDWDAVREAGFSDAETVEIVANVALNFLTNTMNVLARTPIDFPRVELQKVG